jgi:egghead protein (zeste-white 4 protein)
MKRLIYTLHLYIPIFIWAIFGILIIIYTDPAIPSSIFDYILMIGQYIWITPIIYAISNFIGLNKGIEKTTKIYPPAKKTYTILWVSRGQNVQALYNAIKKSIQAKPKFYYPNLCVVTDIEIENQYKIEGVKYLVVPKDYTTSNNVKYKARALEYARQFINTDYTLHLDEESTMTTELYLGVNEFISTNTDAIGQGIILYNSNINEYRHNLLSKTIPIEMIDAVRTGDDFGRFRFQYENLNKPIFGMHGSFMLIPKKVSDDITWDLPGNSITEDAEFSLRATEKNYKFGFVNGYLREQSPHTIGDLIKQRKRWFTGIKTVIKDKTIAVKHKYILATMLFNWSISWLIPIITIFTLISGKSFIPTILIIPVSIITGISFSIYYIGLYINLKPKFSFNTIHIYINMFLLLILQIIPIIEGIGILQALLSPPKTFEVINKK